MFTIRYHAALLFATMLVASGPAAPAQQPKAAQQPKPGQQPKPAQLSEHEAQLFEATCKAVAESFVKDDVDGFLEHCIPKDLLLEVLSPKQLERGADALHKLLLEGNAKRFKEFRKGFQDLNGFTFTLAEVGYRSERAEMYADPKLALKNSYFTIAYANRIMVRIKIEDMVLIGGKYYVIQMD